MPGGPWRELAPFSRAPRAGRFIVGEGLQAWMGGGASVGPASGRRWAGMKALVCECLWHVPCVLVGLSPCPLIPPSGHTHSLHTQSWPPSEPEVPLRPVGGRTFFDLGSNRQSL